MRRFVFTLLFSIVLLCGSSLVLLAGDEVSDPVLSVDRSQLWYGALKSNTGQTPAQDITIRNTGGGSLVWTCISQGSWLRVSMTGGTGSGVVKVSVEPMNLAVGTHTSTVTVTSVSVGQSHTVFVRLIVYASKSDATPFGSFDTPKDGSTVMSSIPVTGWAVDDLGIERVSIWRNAVSGETGSEIYIGNAYPVSGARPDIEQMYPTYPMSNAAGWGYMLLTNTLPGGGNGVFTLRAYAHDYAGGQTYLGSKTITCDNKNAVKPFGAIDAPTQGGEVNGDKYQNIGWVLTPMPNMVPIDGSTITVYIDGVSIGNASYNHYRPDIEFIFPGYANSKGALAYKYFNTYDYDFGVHTIQWVVSDNVGNTDGIGSRYFTVTREAGYPNSTSTARGAGIRLRDAAALPLYLHKPVTIKTGYGKNPDRETLADSDGIARVSIPETGRLVLDLGHEPGNRYDGYLRVGNQRRRLPVGSSLDQQTGKFYWQPGVAFHGDYPLIFIIKESNGTIFHQTVTVTITPKYNNKRSFN
jgi:hypothetical protein